MAQTEYQKEYYKQHREEIIKRTAENQAKRYAENPNYHKERYAIKVAENPYRIWAGNTLRNHRRKGYTVTLTLDELTEMAEHARTCYICGKEITTNVGKNVAPAMDAMSLDRVSNSNDITIENTKICCVQCNISKNSRSLEEFTAYCKHVLESQGYKVTV